jgi:hypothetical protein
MGIYVDVPQTDITLTGTQLIQAENNSWSGIYVNDSYWLTNAQTGKSDLYAGEHNLTINGFTQGSNKYYGVSYNVPKNVTVTNSTVTGLCLWEPQGAIQLTNSTFQNAWQGVVVSWGSFEYWTDLASGTIVDTWWNTLANIVTPLHKPTLLSVDNCQFTNNVYHGLSASWWNKWDQPQTDANKRIDIEVSNSNFTKNGYRGFESYNNNVSLVGCNLSDNGYSGALVWDGAANLQKCTLDNNCFGRSNGSLYGFWEGTKGSWVGCEITHGYNDGRVWIHTIENCSFNGNEGYGLYVTNVNAGSKATIKNSSYDHNYYDGLYAIYSDLEVNDSTFNQNGTESYSGHGLISIYNNAEIVQCNADSNTYGGFYVHGPYATDPTTNRTYATQGKTSLIQNCTANNNYYRGILNWCNSGRIESCQALNTRVPGSTAISGTGIQVGYDDVDQTYQQVIVNSSASGGWVGLYAYNTRTTVENCQFDNSGYGGYYQYSDNHKNLARLDAVNCTFNQNGCFGVNAYNTVGTFTSVQANKNGKKVDGTATGHGGYGLYLYASSDPSITGKSQSVVDSQINENANYGVYVSYVDGINLERCSIKSSGSWAFLDYGSPATLKNNLITNNDAGIYIDDNLNLGVQALNNTLAYNTTTALRIDRGEGEFRNNILSNSQYGICIYNGVSFTNSNNLVFGNTTANYWHSTQSSNTVKGANDINKSPRFENAAQGDFRLAKGSPAINAGYSAVGVVDNDILGVPRPKFKLHEIGAYEFTDPNGSVRVMTWNEQK